MSDKLEDGMTKKHLLEAASLVSESASEDGSWRVKIISEGKGSSGIYTRELLENHHAAFNGLLSFKNHPTGWEGPQARDFTMIAGEILGETWVDTDETGRTAVYANYLPDPEYRDKLARYKNKLGLSIYIEGSGYENENGEFVVDWLNPADPFGSIDVVIAPGARGKFMESARAAYASVNKEANGPDVTSAQDERKLVMDEKDREAINALVTAVTSLVDQSKAESVEAVQAEADKDAGRKAVEAYDRAVTAIDEANLPKEIVESLRAQAKEGVDVTVAIEQAVTMRKALEEAATAAANSDQGRNLGGTLKEVNFVGFGGGK